MYRELTYKKLVGENENVGYKLCILRLVQQREKEIDRENLPIRNWSGRTSTLDTNSVSSDLFTAGEREREK